MTRTAKMRYKYLSLTTLMPLNLVKARLSCVVAVLVACGWLCAFGQQTQPVLVHATGFKLGQNIAVTDGSRRLKLTLDTLTRPCPSTSLP